MKAARSTYEGFIQTIKISAPVIALLTAIYLLAH